MSGNLLDEARQAWKDYVQSRIDEFVECLVAAISKYAGEDDDMGGTKPSDPDDGLDEECE